MASTLAALYLLLVISDSFISDSYLIGDFDDFTFTVPIIYAVFLFIFGVVFSIKGTVAGIIKKGIVVGTLLAGIVTLLLLPLYVSMVSSMAEIFSGSEAFWAYIQVPIFVLGFPFLLLGAVLGASLTWVANRK